MAATGGKNDTEIEVNENTAAMKTLVLKLIRIVLLLCLLFQCTYAQTPVTYWSFDGKDVYADEVAGKKFDVSRQSPRMKAIAGIKGGALGTDNDKTYAVTNFLRRTPALKDFTIEFFFKGQSFVFSTFPPPDFRINFTYGTVLINYTVLRKGKKAAEGWRIPLNGIGVNSYNNLANDEWHHFVFVMKHSGEMLLYIDGVNNAAFQKKITPYEAVAVSAGDGFRMRSSIDELAFYDKALDPGLIRQHNEEVRGGKNYTFRINPEVQKKLNTPVQQKATALDEKEFAPGYPLYDVQALDQLKAFPDPRYNKSVQMPRNFPWMDITYLHRELPQPGGKGFGKTDPVKAVAMTQELAERWNYYIELPCPRIDAKAAEKIYTDPKGLHGALIGFANKRKDLPTATVLFHVQIKPVHAGFTNQRAYVLDQKLPDEYYLRNSSGKVIMQGKKWLSPFAPLDFIQKDAQTTAFYVKQLAQHLNRPVTMLNENGEWFGHMRADALLKQDPDVAAFMKKNKMDHAQLSGWMQNRFDSVYKSTVLNVLGWKNTLFSFYNVSAYNSSYWPDYALRINTNGMVNKTPRSTPAFYPSTPGNWRMASGQLNGYGRIAEGRQKEIALGVKFFSPYVSAGWGFEEQNIRPAQWLALLKSMVMLGADFFYTGYFNITGGAGKWPNGSGPFDPRGYIYQAAMPAYAQAIASQVYNFLDKGQLLSDSGNPLPLAVQGASPAHLILVRKLGKQYLIYGSIQPTSNANGNAPLEGSTTIKLEGRKVTFPIRRQGSMYVLDESAARPVFYQLDGWHQYEHPFYWSKNFEQEAELAANAQDIRIVTEARGINDYDFTDAVSYVECEENGNLVFDIPPGTEGRNVLYIRARSEGKGNVVLSSGTGKAIAIQGKNWSWYRFEDAGISGGSTQIALRIKGKIQVDKIVLSEKNDLKLK